MWGESGESSAVALISRLPGAASIVGNISTNRKGLTNQMNVSRVEMPSNVEERAGAQGHKSIVEFPRLLKLSSTVL